jgi:NAD-dependent deacetylase
VLRPDIVMFGEMIPEENGRRATGALEDCDLFVAIGTSGTVYPANQFVSWAARAGARTVYVNLESIRASDPDSDFDEEYLGKAEEAVPLLFGRLAEGR